LASFDDELDDKLENEFDDELDDELDDEDDEIDDERDDERDNVPEAEVYDPPPPVTDEDVLEDMRECIEVERARFQNKRNKRALIVNRRAVRQERKKIEQEDGVLRDGKCLMFKTVKGKRWLCPKNQSSRTVFCVDHRSSGRKKFNNLGLAIPEKDRVFIFFCFFLFSY
jgi:hypothetical protein